VTGVVDPRWCCAVGAVAFIGCGAPDYGDPGPTVSEVELTFRAEAAQTGLLVLVVDDRATDAAAKIRAEVGLAVGALGRDVVNATTAMYDPARWMPVDIRVLLVRPDVGAPDWIIGPMDDAALGWTTFRATASGADALGSGVGAALALRTTSTSGVFRPLEAAASITSLVRQERPPVGDREAEIAANIATRHWAQIGVAVIATTDDESPNAAESYGEGMAIQANVITPEIPAGNVGEAERHDLLVARYPRLLAWAEQTYTDFLGLGGLCLEGEPGPFALFHVGICGSLRSRCLTRPILEISPGIGACNVQIEMTEPDACVASRGWVDPLGDDGARHARWTSTGGRVCDAGPVAPEVMDRCIHDSQCTDCGSGWCVSQIAPINGCSVGQIRWVGGVIPEHGTVRVRCVEDETPRLPAP
jgi:hypothetical protein